jgi:hypothetical protein
VEEGNELATHPDLLTPIHGIVEDPQVAVVALDLDAAGCVAIAMCSPHRIPCHLVAGSTPGVWVARDAEHNRTNLLAWCIANRNQAAVGLAAEVDHLLL